MIIPTHQIILGTANLNKQYGLDNHIIANREEFLETSIKSGILAFDCSTGYGIYNKVFEHFPDAKIFSKIECFGKTASAIKDELHLHLQDLGVKSLTGLMIHDGDLFIKNLELLEEILEIFSSEGVSENIGFSCYDKIDTRMLKAKNLIVQSISNVFYCQRHSYSSCENIIEFHGRSLFLRGRILSDKFPKYFTDKIVEDQNTSIKDAIKNMSPTSYHILCALNRGCEKVVIGANTSKQLSDIINKLEEDQYKDVEVTYFNNVMIGNPLKW